MPRSRRVDCRWALRLGVNIKVISARLGDASIQITADLYTHPAQHADREAADRFACAVRRRGSS